MDDPVLATDEFVAHGLYDPAVNGPDRLELLHWLASFGVSLEQMEVAAASGNLAAAAGDLLQRADVRWSSEQMARRCGLTVEQLAEVRRASGLAPIDPDSPVFTEADVEAFGVLQAASILFPWTELMGFTRVVGSSIARVADAANTLFLHDVERPLVAAGGTELELAQRSLQAISLSTGIVTVLRMFTRLHLDVAINRSREAFRLNPGQRATVAMGVGFVDLVGFTARSAAMTVAELADLVSSFEAEASDVITDLGGRLVKVIGDEVMFAAVDPSVACAIAVQLLETFAGEPSLAPRGGIAYGEILNRNGDYFGPIVNLAARLVDHAVPGEILATPEVAAHAPTFRFEPAGRRQLKGFADPVPLVALLR